jgi:hypothetical protein
MFMKARPLTNLLFFLLVLEVGCGTHHKTADAQSGNFSPEPKVDRPIVYCWYVADNGAGANGYAFIAASVGRPLRPDERLYHTLNQLGQAVRSQDGGVPIVISKQPDWVPEHWKVRDLTTNEAAQLEDSLRSQQ